VEMLQGYEVGLLDLQWALHQPGGGLQCVPWVEERDLLQGIPADRCSKGGLCEIWEEGMAQEER
jgi:hypothetical protein